MTTPSQRSAPEPAVPKRMPGPGVAAMGRGPAAMMGGISAEKPLNFRASSRRLLALLHPQRWFAVLVLVLGGTQVAFTVLGPRLLGRATDLIFAGYLGTRAPTAADSDVVRNANTTPGHGIDFTRVGQVLLIVLAIYVLASLFAMFQGRLATRVVQRAIFGLRQQVEEKFARLPLSYFDGQQTGEVLSRATNDIDNIAQSMQQTMSQIVTSLLTIIGVLIMMLVISPLLAVIALVTVPASVYVATRIGKRAQPQFVKQWATTGRLNGHIEEMYTGHALVKVFGRAADSKRSFDEQNELLYASSFRAQFVSGLIQPAMNFIGNINYVLIAVAGGLRVASGALSIGDVQAFIQYSRQFTQPLTQVASMSNLLQSGVASAERVFALLDAAEQQPDAAVVSRPGAVHGRVEFEDVSFRYTPDVPLIEHLTLTVAPGQTVAIVGPTGAGKTTLVNLLMRFYEIDSGRICVDGVDISTMSREELRSKTGMVLQDAWLFGGSIADNIAYGADDLAHDDLVEAARTTHVDRFVRTLPDGYDTVIDEEASNVSMGERQLITIARAFVAEPAILILDEATSSVDTRTEVLIQRGMNALRHGRTSFVIAHRLSTIRDADLILVMEAGRIVEQGTHDELLAADGAYARLYAAQFAQAVAEVD